MQRITSISRRVTVRDVLLTRGDRGGSPHDRRGAGQLLERIQRVYSDCHGSDRGDQPYRERQLDQFSEDGFCELRLL